MLFRSYDHLKGVRNQTVTLYRDLNIVHEATSGGQEQSVRVWHGGRRLGLTLGEVRVDDSAFDSATILGRFCTESEACILDLV